MARDQGHDPLAVLRNELVDYTVQSGLVVFHGLLSAPDSTLEVLWDSEQDEDWRRYLDIAKAIGVKVLYIYSNLFDESSIDDAVEKLDADGSTEEHDEWIREQRTKLETFRQKIGLVSDVRVSYVSSGVVHSYHESAPWADAFRELEEEEPPEEIIEATREASRRKAQDLAEKLASDARFAACKNDQQRRFLAQSILPAEEAGSLREIVRLATSIYTVNVRPREERRLQEAATDLKAKGFTQPQIAAELGLTRDRVRSLLGTK